MNRLLSLLLRSFGFRRPTPATRLGRALRRAERAVGVLALLYLGLQIFPQVLFAHSVTTQNITLWSRAPLPPEAATCLGRAAALVRASELAVPGRHEEIFVCNSPGLFRLFSPLAAGAFAYSIPLTDHVFIADADFARDTARSAAPVYNVRRLSAVMAHEITHGLIRHRLGWVRGVLLPVWLAEGCCDYVAHEGSFPDAAGLRLLAAGRDDPSPSFQYFKDRQMVRYLKEDQRLTFDQIAARAHDAAAVEAATRASLRAGTTP